jgi:MoCo/4Fe-4S cofactor protein with predicted Tat translocation signal
VTGQHLTRDQPVQFSHAHHVGSMGIDCRYCHTTVEESAFANIPPTKTCMNCHSQIWINAPILEPVRASFRENRPLEWWRVHDLPDFVYFNHSIHVAKGVGCATCHGPVDKMPLMYQENSLQMRWCLECHRNPAKYVRPKDQVFNMAYERPSDDPGLGERLVKEYKIAGRGSAHELLDVPQVIMDFAAVKSRLAGSEGRLYWRSLGELSDSEQFREYLHRSFPSRRRSGTIPRGAASS